MINYTTYRRICHNTRHEKRKIRKHFHSGSYKHGCSYWYCASPPEESQKEAFIQMDDFDKAIITLFVTAEIMAIGLIGYRFSDGARRIEKQIWQYGLPIANLAAAGMLLGRIWGVV